MAVKGRETKKKQEIKIIRELPKKFREIEEENLEEAEESLEEEIEEENFETFPEFSAETTTPTLKPAETLETSLGNIPSAETRETTRTTTTAEAAADERYEASIYNTQNYMASYEEKVVPTRKDMQEAGILIRPEDIRETKPRTELQEWHEIKEAPRREARVPDAVTKAEPRKEKRKLPFEYEEKRRTI